MKTPDEFIREDFLLRPVRNVDKLVFDGNDVKKLMEDYAAYMLEHSYSLKKMETERLRETRLNPGLHPTMKGAPAFWPGSLWQREWENHRWPYASKDTAEPGIIGKNEEESE